jgi:hypothetical protein
MTSFQTPVNSKSKSKTTTRVGDRAVSKNRWAAFSESDSESEQDCPPAPCKAPRPAAAFDEARYASILAELNAANERDPILHALLHGPTVGGTLWGDIFYAPEPIEPPVFGPAPRPLGTEEDLWAQPFAEYLDERAWGVYNPCELTPSEYRAFMEWMHRYGWDVTEGVDYVVAEPGLYKIATVWHPDTELPPRPWRERAFSFSNEREERCERKGKGGKRPAHVPRFCRAGQACEEKECCRYVHGDEIPKLNQPCAFGADCGAADETGVKRAMCLYLHPGEEWVPGAVIRRIPV